MPAEPFYLNDKLESLVRKCIVFPADGSETSLDHMVARTVTNEDSHTKLFLYSRCVDMTSTFGDEYHKIQVDHHQSTQDGVQITYLFFYNLSPKLPVNLNVAHLIGVTPSHLKKRLFWRGDVVAMKVQPESELIASVKSMDADLLELGPLEEFLRGWYQGRFFERELQSDGNFWKYGLSRCSRGWWRCPSMFEKNFLDDHNELRCAIGLPLLPPHACGKSFAEHAVTLYSAFKAFGGVHHKVTGPPKLPPNLERRIFESCALESPELCTVLVLVAKRVHVWIDPILLATVSIFEVLEEFDHDSAIKRPDRLEQFLVKLANGKPVEYYAQHIKNLAIGGAYIENDKINHILAICTGVENLALSAPARGLDFFENPQAGRNLRRLSIKLKNFHQFLSRPNFYHRCFAKLTHLHLYDDNEDWPTYVGWKNLTSLTHLALACAVPEETMQLLQTLPTVQYLATGHYCLGEKNRYIATTVNNAPRIRAAWGVRAVFLSKISMYDWDRGARGEGDFWDVVEREVKRRLEEESIVHDGHPECDHEQGQNVHPGRGCGTEHERQPGRSTPTSSTSTSHNMSDIGVRQQLNEPNTAPQLINSNEYSLLVQGLDVGEEACSLVSAGVTDHLTNERLLRVSSSVPNIPYFAPALRRLCR